MYGAFSGMSFGLVALVALAVALAVLASPLLAVILAVIAAFFLLIGMAAMRRGSARQDQTEGGAPDTQAAGPRARGTSGRRATGEPASGEG
jgi:membrane protein implicated in regulation of membrane protease activity